MSPRSAHRATAIAVAGLLAAAVLHDAVPHEGIHEALAQVAHTATPHGSPEATALPTNTATASPTGTQTATTTPTATSPPTMTPAVTSTPSGGSGTCAVHDPNAWHGTLGPGGCQYGHEHGDQPPGWVTLAFTGPFNTSAAENGQAPSDAMPDMKGKHPAMKGLLGPSTSIGQFYLRYHMASNVLDRMARFHSFELWYRDNQGGTSHVAGWTNSGIPSRIGPGTQGAGGRRDICSAEIDIRPEVEVVMSLVGFKTCNPTEHWYFYPSGAAGAPGMEMPTISILVEATTITYQNEYANTSMTTWQRTGALGTAREGSVIWPPRGGDTPPPSGSFWTTQFGAYVSGPSDPRCSGQTVFPANPTATINPFDASESYANVCLQQTISPTVPGFIQQQAFPPEYSGFGIRLPN
jgi:hypothetical protein